MQSVCYHNFKQMTIDTIFSIAVLIFSAVVHEVSHGYAAFLLGDPTAKYEGRLTMNPLKHIELFGSIILPVLLALSGTGFIVGWAKPVPYNPYNLKNQKWGEAVVAAAGPFVNICIAIFFGLVLRLGGGLAEISSLANILSIIVFINILLAVFNLVPIPPLDGSKILFSFLPYRFSEWRRGFEKYSGIALIIFILFLWPFVAPIVSFVFQLITGIYL